MNASSSLATIQVVLITYIHMKIEKTIIETILAALNLIGRLYPSLSGKESAN